MNRTLDEILFKHLTTLPTFVALAGDRMYPDVLPQNVVYPAVAYTLESEEEVMTQTGPSKLHQAIYRFEIYGETIQDVEQVSDVIEDEFLGHAGPLDDMNYFAVPQHSVDRTYDSESRAFYKMVRMTIWYNRQ